MNLTETKYALTEVRSNRIEVIKSTSEVYHNDYYTDYQKKKEEEKRAIHEEIKRVSV